MRPINTPSAADSPSVQGRWAKFSRALVLTTLMTGCDDSSHQEPFTLSHTSPDASPVVTAPVSPTTETKTESPPAPITPTATASSVPTASATSTLTAAPSVSVKVPEPSEIKLKFPPEIKVLGRDTWEAQAPDTAKLNAMEHPENAPVMDIVVMYSGVITDAEHETQRLRSIQTEQMTKKNMGDISIHYAVGPSGKIYQGRDIRYRAEGTVGSGMGRFNDPWNKAAVMILGTELTKEAHTSLSALNASLQAQFGRLYKTDLEAREYETRSMLSQPNTSFGYDQVRIRLHTSLPKAITDLLRQPKKEEDGTKDAGVPDAAVDAQ